MARCICWNPANRAASACRFDFFFRSLAEDQHERAIGIVLSGTGSDGTLGVRAIKGENGMVMAQDVQSAEHGRHAEERRGHGPRGL